MKLRDYVAITLIALLAFLINKWAHKNYPQYTEPNSSASVQVTASYSSTEKDAGLKYTDDDLVDARNSGKADGKIEALLLISEKKTAELTASQIDRIIDIATRKTKEDLEKNIEFLSLLSQAAYHKGLHSGLEANEESKK